MVDYFRREGATFIDDCLSSFAKFNDLDKYIEEWQTGDFGHSLAEHLGLTDKQYQKFEKDNLVLLDILRKKGYEYN